MENRSRVDRLHKVIEYDVSATTLNDESSIPGAIHQTSRTEG